MHLFILSAILQIACCVHVVRTGRPLYWIFILLVFSYLAVAIYFFAEILPGPRNDPSARKVVRKVRERIDPDREKRSAHQQFGLSDTQTNRRRLADETLRSGDFAQAAELYRGALKGLYDTDPDLMLGLARAQFGMGQAAEARATLDALIAANPTYRSKDGHLLYARTVEASGDQSAALHEYESVVQGFPGEEARLRYGRLLLASGDTAKAREVFSEILTRSAASPKYYRREQREWIEAAKREISALSRPGAALVRPTRTDPARRSIPGALDKSPLPRMRGKVPGKNPFSRVRGKVPKADGGNAIPHPSAPMTGQPACSPDLLPT